MRNPIKTAAIALPALLLGACSTAPVNLASTYTPPPAPVGATKTAARSAELKCSVYLESVLDQRSDKNQMGNIAGNPVHAADMKSWVSSGIASLTLQGYHVDQQQATPDDTLFMDVELLKAYMISITTSKSTNMVVRVTYKKPDGSVLATQIYRGVDTSIDWSGGEGETNESFRRATTQLVDQVGSDLYGYCKADAPAVARAGQ